MFQSWCSNVKIILLLILFKRSENGPFYFKDFTSTIEPVINEYAWNKAAHLVYLETPAGVGFSTKTDNEP